MTANPRISPDARKNAQAIIDLIEQELRVSGFISRKTTTIWRSTSLKYDILDFDVISKARCIKWGVPLGSFSLDPSCLFPFLPRGGFSFGDIAGPEKGFGQIRFSMRRNLRQPSVNAPNLWWPGDSPDIFEAVLKDLGDQVESIVVPFFHRFDDAQEVLRTFLEDEDNIGRPGIWDFGKIGSPRRLLYIGFAAIKCERWGLAISSLLECKEKIMKLPNPIGEQIQADILPYLNEGLSCADGHSQWSIAGASR